jgi:predicted phosphoribosyltransferase
LFLFRDRAEAGTRLADALLGQLSSGPDTVVLGLPRGGVIVAAPVAHTLGAPLDVIVPRKIGAPGEPELAVGAMALAGGEPITVFEEASLARLAVPEDYVRREIDIQRREIERREAAYRKGPPVDLHGRRVILVDDGLATGLTMRAAAAAVRMTAPSEVVVAVPVAPREVVRSFTSAGLRVVVLETPSPFFAVGRFYADFHEVGDDEVLTALLH